MQIIRVAFYGFDVEQLEILFFLLVNENLLKEEEYKTRGPLASIPTKSRTKDLMTLKDGRRNGAVLQIAALGCLC